MLRLKKARNFSSCAFSTVTRQYQYFENVEIKNNIGIIRINGPNKMNTISLGMQLESENIFKNEILPNKDIKAIVFISSKPDNFIAGADINQIKETQDKSKLKVFDNEIRVSL